MWFIVAIIAFFLLALAAVTDKYLLSKTKIVPVSYAFYIVFLGGLFSSLFILFDSSFHFPKNHLVILSLGGLSLFLGLYFTFRSIEKTEISKANPIIISLTPIFVFFLSLTLGLQIVSLIKIAGGLLIVISAYLLSQVGLPKTRLKLKVWVLVLTAALFMGASHVYSKAAYEQISFINAFVYIRWFALIAGILFVTILNKWSLVLPQKKSNTKSPKDPWLIFLMGQAAGSGGVILQQYAVKLGNVVLVTALNAVQFFFIILLVYILSKFFPKVLSENISAKFMAKKIIYSLLLAVGIVLILI